MFLKKGIVMFSHTRLDRICFLFVFLLFLSGCDFTAEEIDLEAQRVKSVASLITAIARQPEMEPALIEQHETCSNFDGRFLNVTESALIEARIIAFSKYIEGSARQPEFEPELKKHFNDYAGLLTPEVIGRYDSALYYRNFALGKLIESVARQPEFAPVLKQRAAEILGRFDDYPLKSMKSQLVLAGRVQLVGKYIEAVSRQPEMKELIEAVLIEFAGDKSLVVNSTDCLVNSARLFVLGKLTEATARQPELFLDSGEEGGMFSKLYQEEVGSFQADDSSSIGCSLPETIYVW